MGYDHGFKCMLVSYAYISPHCVFVKGAETIEQYLDETLFLKTLYKQFQLNYPKFYKMDDLCKLAFLSSELVLQYSNLQAETIQETSLVFANVTSSAHADLQHQQNIEKDSASPAVFVYTLPNIALGEVAIKHKITAENIFYIQDAFSAEALCYYAMLTEGEYVLVNWVEFGENEQESLAFLLKKNEEKLEETTKEITTIYNKLHGKFNN